MTNNDAILIVLIVLVAVLLIAVLALIIIFLKNKPKPVEEKEDNTSKNELDALLQFQNTIGGNIEKIRDKVEEKLDIINNRLGEHISKNEEKTKENINELKVQIERVVTTQEKITNVEESVNSLKQVLKGNQTRGMYGERILHIVLENAFVNNGHFFEEQYTFNNKGEKMRPDAVVFAPEPYKMVCIDSKFPFQSYAKILDSDEESTELMLKEFKKDLKTHINKVSEYIVENVTASFAFLFIPNEALYIFIYNECPDIVDYADRKKVILCSPSSLYPFLTTLLSINIDYQRQEHMDEIMVNLKDVKVQLGKLKITWSDFYEKTLRAFNNKVDDINSSIVRVEKSFKKLDEFNKEEDTVNIE